MKGLIRTLAGDIKPSEVNYALTHEHGFLGVRRYKAAEVAKFTPAIERRLASEFRKLLKQGVNVFVDVTPRGLGRRSALMLLSSERAGMHIVGSTGYYSEDSTPAKLRKASVSRLAKIFYSELTEGMDGLKSKAGIIKLGAQQYEPSRVEKKHFLAGAEAHKQTGAPITTHAPRGPLAQFTLLKEAGVAPERIALGHVEVSAWVDIMKCVRAGAMLCFTNFGGEEILPEDMMIAQIAGIVRRGFVRHIMISVDMSVRIKNGRLVYRWPGGYTQIVDRVIPKLAQAGLKPSHIETILHRNPARHLAWR